MTVLVKFKTKVSTYHFFIFVVHLFSSAGTSGKKAVDFFLRVSKGIIFGTFVSLSLFPSYLLLYHYFTILYSETVIMYLTFVLFYFCFFFFVFPRQGRELELYMGTGIYQSTSTFIILLTLQYLH